MRKSTNKELVEELEARNSNGQYDQLIANAKSGRYHDYKNPEDVVCGKVEFVNDVSAFPELMDLRSAIMAGDYDEVPDEEDKAMMRQDLPQHMWNHFGL